MTHARRTLLSFGMLGALVVSSCTLLTDVDRDKTTGVDRWNPATAH